jgi:hypothetical protein
MDLVNIYGPAGVGKFTVASLLAKSTGYKLFHNHVSIDCIKPVFSFSDAAFWELVGRIRDDVIDVAAREDVSLIFTQVYEHPGDLEHTQRRFESVERHGGRVCSVQLRCEMPELERRVVAPHRAVMGKTSTVEDLRQDFALHDLDTPIPGHESLCIDNTHLSPEDVADLIVKHYGLSVLAP